VADWAVIFDVDGVLLELTRDEEEVFFTALSKFVPTEDLSRDWNSYRIRNDEDIITEILERNSLPLTFRSKVMNHYVNVLQTALQSRLQSVEIKGAKQLFEGLVHTATLGIATANVCQAAALRLQQAGLWPYISSHAEGADGGGHKSVILARLLTRIKMPRSQVIYIGDNINDVEAGRENGVHFIGFSTDASRRAVLQSHGARQICANHSETFTLLKALMA
jgi:phosphoglycolate phosphatase-like HAD superfamily hydrolase